VSRVEDAKYRVALEVKGKILGVRTVQDRGRVQIPKKVREELNIKDGDSVYWIKYDEKMYVMKAVIIK